MTAEPSPQISPIAFTSDLSVDEFLLVDDAGYDPIGLVTGNCAYHVGFQQSRWTQSGEMQTLTQAMYSAREQAMRRMEKQALELDADGVIGVELGVDQPGSGFHVALFVAFGTAVRWRGEERRRGAGGRPFTATLSGQDFWTLSHAGYRPVGMVMGNCVYHVAYQSWRAAVQKIGKNAEMENFTQALYDARELAMERIQVEAQALRAEGIVGMRIEEDNRGWESHVIEFFAIGTAVVPVEGSQPIPAPTGSLNLRR
jgi:uncharacterized protein YbjQ (UPF0145 family)